MADADHLAGDALAAELLPALATALALPPPPHKYSESIVGLLGQFQVVSARRCLFPIEHTTYWCEYCLY
jgi:hypothetical protein